MRVGISTSACVSCLYRYTNPGRAAARPQAVTALVQAANVGRLSCSFGDHCRAMSAGESFEVERDGVTGAEAGRRDLTDAGVGVGVAGGDAAQEARAPGPARSVCQSYLSGGKIYSCCHCRAHLASHDEIISKSFQGHHGRAYLFNNLCAPPLLSTRVTSLTELDAWCA